MGVIAWVGQGNHLTSGTKGRRAMGLKVMCHGACYVRDGLARPAAVGNSTGNLSMQATTHVILDVNEPRSYSGKISGP